MLWKNCFNSMVATCFNILSASGVSRVWIGGSYTLPPEQLVPASATILFLAMQCNQVSFMAPILTLTFMEYLVLCHS